MAYPPPVTPISSLPPRPPPPAISLAPRQVATVPHLSVPPQLSYAALLTDYSTPYQPPPYPGYIAPAITAPTTPQIFNPFPLPVTGPLGDPCYDPNPELQAQIAQQQSIYDPSNPENPKARAAPKPAAVEAGVKSSEKVATVIRHGGGQTWADPTLLEWDPSHFRLFVGNLAGEVTDDSLLKAFSKHPSVKKARVVRDKRTTKSKGYGFVAFGDGDEYFRAAKEMQGKYIGSHPVLLKRSNTEIKPVIAGGNKTKGGRIDKKKKKKGKGAEGRTILG